jgi:hypothetical protein
VRRHTLHEYRCSRFIFDIVGYGHGLGRLHRDVVGEAALATGEPADTLSRRSVTADPTSTTTPTPSTPAR